MTRQSRLLLGVSTTVGITLLLAWLAVQALVIRPGIGEREQARTAQVLEAAALMRQGTAKNDIEDRWGVDLRIFLGEEAGPPPGHGWIREETARGTVWKRRGGKYDIAAWTGQGWVVLHEDLPIASTLALAFFAAGLPVVALMFGLSRRSQHQEVAEAALSRMASGNLSERLDEEAGGAEVRRVAAAVNRMAEQLQALLKSDRERMAGAHLVSAPGLHEEAR